MKQVKFKREGKWAETDPLLPQFKVEAGDIHACTDGLADLIVAAKAGEIIKPVLTDDEKQVIADAEALATKKAAAAKDLAGAKQHIERLEAQIVTLEGDVTEMDDVIASQQAEIEALKAPSVAKKAEAPVVDKAKAESKNKTK